MSATVILSLDTLIQLVLTALDIFCVSGVIALLGDDHLVALHLDVLLVGGVHLAAHHGFLLGVDLDGLHLVTVFIAVTVTIAVAVNSPQDVLLVQIRDEKNFENPICAYC